MRNESLDPEVLAALLDGTLPGEEREEALEILARSPDDYEAFVEAASLLRDLDAEEAAATPPFPFPTAAPARETGRRWRYPGVKVWLPVAAVLAGVLLVPRLVPGGGDAGAPIGLLDGAALVGSPGNGSLAAALGPEWDQPGWSVRRGGGGSRSGTRREFRIGVRLAEMEVALDARDPEAVRRVAPELVSLLEPLDGAEGAIGLYQGISDAASRGELGGTLEGDGDRAAQELAGLFEDSPWFGLGAWIEQARLATLARRAEFFDDRAVQALEELADRVAQQPGEDASVAERLRSLHGLVDDGASPATLGRIQAELVGVIREVG